MRLNNTKDVENVKENDGISANLAEGINVKNTLSSASPMQGRRKLEPIVQDTSEKKALNDTSFLTHYKKPDVKRKTLGADKERTENSENDSGLALLKF